MGSSSTAVDKNWDFVWKVKLPNKVRVFFWRLLQGALPVVKNMFKRRVVDDVLCPVCKCGEESIYHVFAECHVRLYWALSPISNILLMAATTSGNIWEWILAVRNLCTIEEFEYFVCSCWSIWANRNKIIHECMGFDPLDANHFIARYIRRYQEAQTQFTNTRPPYLQTNYWTPPSDGTFKI